MKFKTLLIPALTLACSLNLANAAVIAVLDGSYNPSNSTTAPPIQPTIQDLSTSGDTIGAMTGSFAGSAADYTAKITFDSYPIWNDTEYDFNAATIVGTKTATWTFGNLTDGYKWDVFATWHGTGGRSDSVPFTITGGGTVLVNQKPSSAADLVLSDDGGTSNFNFQKIGTATVSGGEITVTVANDANEWVIMDAVAIRAVSESSSELLVGTAANQYHIIATDDLGKPEGQPHVMGNPKNETFSDLGKQPKTMQTAATDNKALELIYPDLYPAAHYRLKLYMPGFAQGLVQRVEVNGTTLKQTIPLTHGKVEEVELDIPQELANQGTLSVKIIKVEGDRAALSYAKLYSTERDQVVGNAKEQIIKERIETLDIAIPRISPIPASITGVKQCTLNLDGVWKFNPAPEPGFEELKSVPDWSDIKVPGQWIMRGFDVKPNVAAAYFRTFEAPSDWEGHRVKVLFEGVYSDTVVYVNGKNVASHEGGFTAFEADVTDALNWDGENTLSLSVKSESLADQLAKGSRYAGHNLGGINRSVTLFALPEANISSLTVQTSFDEQYEDATLTALVELSNEGTGVVDDLTLGFALSPWKSDQTIALDSARGSAANINVGQTGSLTFQSKVAKPLQWNCETPNLYVLTCTLRRSNKVLETVRQRFGFRTVEVSGTQMLINGKPVKLRGVARHEAHPREGRSVPVKFHRKDVELFRGANVNLIRTSHYPPNKALMEAADELGMFIECEGPFCWTYQDKPDPVQTRELTVRQNLEMIQFYKNHPSVIMWSIANESHWNDHFDASGKAMAKLDPTRPVTFEWRPWSRSWQTEKTEDEHICAVVSEHYPGNQGFHKLAKSKRPVNIGEFAHLNAYNREELAADPGLRSEWGKHLSLMWNRMYDLNTVAGGSIWSGIDSTFFWDIKKVDETIEKRTAGYGGWGPIDGWRRLKPEWWGMKKAYSPIWIKPDTVVRQQNGKLVIPVQNRQAFSNLNRYTITWNIGSKSGMVSADLNPGESGQLEIPFAGQPKVGDTLELRVDDPRGFEVNDYRFPLAERTVLPTPSPDSVTHKILEKDDKWEITAGRNQYVIARETGLFEDLTLGENKTPVSGPHLMILPIKKAKGSRVTGDTPSYEPFTPVCSGWKASAVTKSVKDGDLTVTVEGAYKEAAGSFTYTFKKDGSFTIGYSFKLTINDLSARQIGIVFQLPNTFDTLSWDRKGYWTTYPEWHIARLKGEAKAFDGVEARPFGPRDEPSQEWRKNLEKGGSYDFISTKHNICQASLRDASGLGLKVYANGDQHVRAWVLNNKAHLLIASHAGGSGDGFIRLLSRGDERDIKKGGAVNGLAILRFLESLNASAGSSDDRVLRGIE